MKNSLLVLLCIAAFQVFAQSVTFTPFNTQVDPATKAHINQFHILALDPQVLEQEIDAIPGNVKKLAIRTPEATWMLELYEYSLLSPKLVRNTTDPKNPTRLPNRKDFRTFKGSIKGKSSMVSLSIADGFMKLMIDDGQNRYFIEPLDKGSLSPKIPASQQYLLYKTSDVNPIAGVRCGAENLNKGLNDAHRQIERREISADCPICVEVQIGLAADYSMFSKYGSVAAVENQMLTIMADVQTVFDNEFTNDYEYVVTGLWASDDVTRDPWNMTRDINEQLTIFTANAQNIFWGSEYEVATNWTAKFTTGVIGLAYLSQVCMATPYNVCSDYIGPGGRQGDYLTLQAHELGHNWSMEHDPGLARTIMAPTINGSTQWSFASVFSLNNYVGQNQLVGGCLAICPNSAAPEPDFIADVTYGCQPVTIHFKDLSKNTDKWEWSFPGGTPATSTQQNPVVVYKVAGTYEVSLKASNARCEVSVTKLSYIEVNDVPVANFSFGVNAGREVFFIDQSVRANEYLWSFGDGETSDETNPIHIYNRDSTYEVTLKVTNDCGTHTFKKKVSVISLPIADFEADTIGGCAPKIIKFFDKSTNNVVKWVWEFPGGSPGLSFNTNPIVRYDNPGMYDVKLTVYSTKYNHSLTKKIYISIDSLPDAEFSQVVNGNTVDFSNLSRYAKTHFWNFGDGNTSTIPNPSHTYTEGRYDIMYVVSNGCGYDTAYSQVAIGQKPVAGFQVSEPLGCIPYQVQFTNTSTAAATDFRWYFPGGNPSTSTARNPVVTYTGTGQFDVSLVAYNALFSDSVAMANFITVKELPTSAFSNAVSGFKVFFTNQAVGANNYFWNFGDSQISFEKEPVHEYGSEGEFNVQLIVQNECGWDTFQKNIAVYLIPKVNYAADTLKGCAPLTVQFYDRSSIDVIEWDWQFENGSPSVSTSKNPKVVFSKPGKYTVKLTVRNTNGTNALTRVQYIQVVSPVLCPEHPKGDKTLVDSKIIENPFGDESSQLEFRSSSAKPVIFPNPVDEHLTILSDASDKRPAQLELYALSGKKVVTKTLDFSAYSFDLSNLPDGTYILKIISGTGTYMDKIIVSH